MFPTKRLIPTHLLFFNNSVFSKKIQRSFSFKLAYLHNKLYIYVVLNNQLDIYQIQYFTEPARSDDLRPNHHFLILNFEGLERGTFAGHDFVRPEPFLAVTLANEKLSYECTAEHRKWIMSFLSPDIRAGRLPHLLEIRYGTVWITVPRVASLSPASVMRLDENFRSMEQAFSKPTPANIFCVETGILGLLSHLAGQETALSRVDIAADMKRRLEDRTLMGKRIAELEAGSGYSRDYPGLLFKREFGISPLAYRNRCRMQLALDLLLTNKNKSVKEIALELGFKHLSHFSGLFRRTFGLSPRKMRNSS